MKSSTIHWNAPEGDKACLYVEELFFGAFLGIGMAVQCFVRPHQSGRLITKRCVL